MAEVKGGRGVTGMSLSGKTDREMGYGAGKGDRETPSRSYPRIGFGAITPPGTSSRMLSQKFSTKYTPGDYAAYRKALAAKKPVVAAKPVAKKPVAKPAQVISNVTNAKMSPTQNSTIKNKPPATRFGTVTGKTTGTRVSGGGGYGGGGNLGGARGRISEPGGSKR